MKLIRKNNKKFIIIILLFSLFFNGITPVHADVTIRIIQGTVFIDSQEIPVESGIMIKFNVSDGQEKTTYTKEYNEDDNLNYGIGFTSINEGENISFSIYYQGSFQHPIRIEMNNTPLEQNILTITSKEIYHVNLYLDVESLPTPSKPKPTIAERNVPTTITLQWECNTTMVEQAKYDIILSTTTTLNSSDTIANNLSNTFFTPACLQYNTTYYWQVRLKDNHNTTSNSPIWNFTTKTKSTPHQPTKPIPANSSINCPKNQIIEWEAMDPDDEPITFDVYFGNTTPPPMIQKNHSGNTYKFNNLTYNTTYYWKITAWDAFNQSNTSQIWEFTISESNLKPNTPSNPFPADNETNTSININLTWQGGDQDSDTVFYGLFYGTNTNPTLKEHRLNTSFYSIESLAYNTKYYWKIVAYDEENATANSSIWSFTTQSKASAGIPTAHAGGPYAGFVGESILFDASLSTDDQDVIEYRWDFINDGLYDTTWLNESTISHTYIDIYHGTVRVMVRDANNLTDTATASVSIETANNPPSLPTIEGPSSAKANTTIAINFSSSDTDGDVIKYRIDWGDSSNPTDITGSSGATLTEEHTYAQPDWYTITITASDTSNAERSATHFIIVDEEVKNTATDSNEVFPWTYIIILLIFIIIIGIIWFLYKNEKLTFIKNNASSSNNYYSFKKNFSKRLKRNNAKPQIASISSKRKKDQSFSRQLNNTTMQKSSTTKPVQKKPKDKKPTTGFKRL